jgi:mono/diheme cytochrome c family protein
MKRQISLAVLVAVFSTTGALAQDFVQSGGAKTLPQTEGKALYNAVCSGCHMPDGSGAIGAGHYPALANNEFVESPEAVIAWVINGYRAMPPLGGIMNDAQIAEVVNYVRHDLGYAYEGDTTAEDVAAAR